MKKVAILLRRPPYGDINAAEAVRHALGAAGAELDVSLVLLDSGALAAKQEQDEEGTGFTSIGEALADCVGMGVGVYTDKASLRQEQLDETELIEGVSILSGAEIGELLHGADQTLIF